MARSRLWWLAFAVVQVALPAVTAWAVARPEKVQDVRYPARPPRTVGQADVVWTRGYPLVWSFWHWYYDLSPAGEIEGEGRPVGDRHRMLPALQLLLALTLPGTLFTMFRRRPIWPVRWVRVFFLTALTTFVLTLADQASDQWHVLGWNECCSPLGPLLQKPTVRKALRQLDENRTAYNVISTDPPRGTEGLSAGCLLFSLVALTLAYRPWRRRAEPTP